MTEYLILIIQLNLAILDEFIDNKSPFYNYLLNIDHFLWQGLIGGAIDMSVINRIPPIHQKQLPVHMPLSNNYQC